MEVKINKLFSNKNVVKILALVLVGVFIVTMSYKENQFKSKASDESINVLKDEDIDTSDDMDEEDFDEEDFDEENIQNGLMRLNKQQLEMQVLVPLVYC